MNDEITRLKAKVLELESEVGEWHSLADDYRRLSERLIAISETLKEQNRDLTYAGEFLQGELFSLLDVLGLDGNRKYLN